MSSEIHVTIKPAPEFSQALTDLAELAETTDPQLDFDALIEDEMTRWYELVPDLGRAPGQFRFTVRPSETLLRLIRDLKGESDD